jgi:excisionase family DNA binding protein
VTIPRHYKTSELAELLNCHEETILRLAQKGEIESIYLGGERRYPEPAVQDFLNRKRAPVRRTNAAVVEIAPRRDDRATRPRRTT